MILSNIINGVEVECQTKDSQHPDQVLIRDSRGILKAIVEIFVDEGNCISFHQKSPATPSEAHNFQSLQDQQFCGARLSDGHLCCLPPNHNIHISSLKRRPK